MDGFVDRQALQDIADAIREKNGSSDTYTPSEMAEAIKNIAGGEGLNFSSLIPFGFPADIAEREDSLLNEMLIYTKSHIKEYMTLDEAMESQDKMLFFNDIEQYGYTDIGSKIASKPYLFSVGDVKLVDGNAASRLFIDCINLISVGNIITPASQFSYVFAGCTRLETVGELTSTWSGGQSPSSFMNGCNNLVNFGGINNLKWTLSLTSPKLSAQSVANIMKKAGENTSGKYLSLNATAKANFLAECEINEEFMEIYNEFINIKGWTLS